MDFFKAPHFSLAKVAAAGRSDIVVPSFIRQVQRLSFLREVHLWSGKVEISITSILFFPFRICNTQAENEPSPLLTVFLLVANDFDEELGSVGGHKIRVAIDQLV